MKIIINETHLDKLEKMFDKSMERFSNLERSDRDYYDDDWGYHMGLAFYEDIDEDWEDDNFVFKMFEPEDDEIWILEYSGYGLKDVIALFGKSMFEKLLKPWFEKNYEYKITNVKEV